MDDSLGEGSEGGILGQSLACSCPIQESYRVEVGVRSSRGVVVLSSTSVVGLEINLMQKQGIEDCEKSDNLLFSSLMRTHAHHAISCFNTNEQRSPVGVD
jgi:hypothetical protein